MILCHHLLHTSAVKIGRVKNVCTVNIELNLITIYLDIGEVYLLLLQEANEFLEIVYSWEIVTIGRPYGLQCITNNKRRFSSKFELQNN